MLAIPAALGLSALLPAQDVVTEVQGETHAVLVAGAPAVSMGFAPQASTFQFIAAEPAMLGKTVTGAPYSGEGFTETVQILADGTRITHKHSKKVWRDAQGRTREESTLPMLGPWTVEGDAPKLVAIFDPVAKVAYTLNDKDKTAIRRKTPDLGMMMPPGADGVAGVRVMQTKERPEMTVRDGGVAGPKGDVMIAAPAEGVTFTRAIHAFGGPGKEEAIGTQIMEGVKVEGKRHTNTIKAGEIGNDRDLVSVTERWTSPELQVLVRMTSKDPQMGETTYRLTNLSRTEPAASLFQVPADYAVTDSIERFRFERKFEPK
jgi:hypothetical protein